jgi:adenylate kinase family enzyme
MNTSAFIFIGQSGCGKGTQVQLLQETLHRLDSDHSVLYLETGRRFRELITSDLFTARKTKAVMEEGLLPPPFLGVHAWTHFLIEEYDGTGHCVMDGTPRVPDEVPILLSACKFYGWETHVIFIDVGDEWAYERTKVRGRADDTDEKKIWGRIEWFHQSVVPTIELLRNAPDVMFHQVHGEQTIEEVHAEICRELGLS